VVAAREPDPRLLNLLSVEHVLGNPHDRPISGQRTILEGNDSVTIPVDPGIGPCRSIRFQSFLSGEAGEVAGMKVATIQVTGRDGHGRKTGFFLPLHTGVEVADQLAGNEGIAYHPPVRVYRRYGVEADGRTLFVQWYDTRLDFPEILSPEEISIRHFHPRGSLTVVSVALEKDPEASPFERTFETEDGTFPVYRNRDALPRAWVVFSAEVFGAREDLLERLGDPGWDPKQSVLLEEPVSLAVGPGDATAAISRVERSPSRFFLDVDLSRDGVVVFSEVFYPGWKARVDGETVPILRANGCLRAVPVPAGSHRVEMSYLPRGLLFGVLAGFGAAGLVIAGVGVVWWSRKRELDTLLAEGADQMTTKVLVVEDEADTRTVISESLNYYGFQVSTAKDGMEALEKLEKDKPEVVLLDMNLPVLSGWETLQMMKADQALRDIPVIALTASTSVASEARALSLGCADFIPKPCEPKDVVAKIKRVLERQRLL
jgi:CheY-like chemotaxis protein